MTQPLTPDQEEARRKAAQAQYQNVQDANAAAQQGQGQNSSLNYQAANPQGQGAAYPVTGAIAASGRGLGAGIYGAGKAAVGAVGALGGLADAAKGVFTPAKMSAYDPNKGDFQLKGTPAGASELAAGYDQDRLDALTRGTNQRKQMDARADMFGQQGAGIQAAQDQVAAGNQAQGAANASSMAATAMGYANQAQSSQFRPGVNVGYGQAQAYGQQGQADRTAQYGVVGQQLGFANQGPGPSAAQAQLQQGADQAMMQNLALARSGRGMGQNAAALRGAVAQNADMQAQVGQQAAGLRAQEAANWRGQQLQAYGQAQQGLQSLGGQSLQGRGLAAQEAQFQGQLSDAQRARNDAAAMGYAQLGLNAQQFGMNNQLSYEQLAGQNLGQGYQYGLGYNQLGQTAMGQGMQYDLGMGQLGQQYAGMGLRSYEDQLNANMAYEQLKSGNIMQANAANTTAAENNRMGLIGMGANALGSLSSLSDIRAKTDILPLDVNPVEQREQAISQSYADMLAAQQNKPKDDGNGGLLGSILSDERDKRRVRDDAAALGDKPSSGSFADMDAADRKYSDYLSAQNADRSRGDFPVMDRADEKYSDYLSAHPQSMGAMTPDEVPRFREQAAPAPSAIARAYGEGGAFGPGSDARASLAGYYANRDAQMADLGRDLRTRSPQARSDWGTVYPTPRQPDYRALDERPAPDFRSAPGYSYEYKNPSAPGAAPGRHVGPMAQDLQRTVPGVVQHTPHGLAVDAGRLTLANTAALSQAQRKNDALSAELDDLHRQVEAMGYGSAAYPTPEQPVISSDASSKKRIADLEAENGVLKRSIHGGYDMGDAAALKQQAIAQQQQGGAFYRPLARPAAKPAPPEDTGYATSRVPYETTDLAPDREHAFQDWAKRNRIKDVNDPEAHYDYRGYFKEHGAAPVRWGVDHFPDTYKQHGHPTFSVESKYSAGPGDGGTWNGDEFVPADQKRRRQMLAAYGAEM